MNTSLTRRQVSGTSEKDVHALIVDDHPIVREALIEAMSSMDIFDRIDVASSLGEAQRLLGESAGYALAILDLHLEDSDGRTTLLGLRERFPDVPILVFTGDNSVDNIVMAFECGARGFATKASPVSVVRGAIGLVLAGGSYIPPEAAKVLGFAQPPPAARTASMPAERIRFSPRQEQVFQLLLQGMPNKVIGARLDDMAEGTVKAHLNAIYRALRVRTRVAAILKARQLGMI